MIKKLIIKIKLYIVKPEVLGLIFNELNIKNQNSYFYKCRYFIFYVLY